MMLEALVGKGGGWSTIDARAASEAELIEALGKAHGCNYTPISSAEVNQKRLDRGWVKQVEIYDQDEGICLKEIYLLRRPLRKSE